MTTKMTQEVKNAKKMTREEIENAIDAFLKTCPPKYAGELAHTRGVEQAMRYRHVPREFYVKYLKEMLVPQWLWLEHVQSLMKERVTLQTGEDHCHTNYCNGVCYDCLYKKRHTHYCDCGGIRDYECKWCCEKRCQKLRSTRVYGYFCGDKDCYMCTRFFCLYSNTGCDYDFCRACHPERIKWYEIEEL